MAGAAITAVRSTEVRQAARSCLPHLASSSSIIWNRPPHAEHHPKSLTSPTHYAPCAQLDAMVSIDRRQGIARADGTLPSN